MSVLLTQATGAARSSGGRMTSQRRLVLETLELMGGHPTAEQVYRAAHARSPGIHPATVYRTLGWLADSGILSASHMDAGRPDRCGHFDPTAERAHHHFICTVCEQIIEFDAPEVTAARPDWEVRAGGRVERAVLTLYGVCTACDGGKGS
jgi:Fe2+ or Zn2+ uptake regulation protein